MCSSDLWTHGFLVLSDAQEGFCGMTGNEIEKVEAVHKQVYFRLLLCVARKDNAYLQKLLCT